MFLFNASGAELAQTDDDDDDDGDVADDDVYFRYVVLLVLFSFCTSMSTLGFLHLLDNRKAILMLEMTRQFFSLLLFNVSKQLQV